MKDIVKVFFAFVLAVMMSNGVSAQDHGDSHHKTSGDGTTLNDDPTITKDGVAGVTTEDGLLYGVDFKSGEAMTLSEVLTSSEKLDGQIITVKGYVSDVCAKAGCWLVMTENDNTVRVVTMHEFLVPTGFAGKNAIITGKFKVREFSEDEEKHYNDESANPKDEIVARDKTYEIEATGIKFVD